MRCKKPVATVITVVTLQSIIVEKCSLSGGTGPLSVGAGGAPCAAGFARPINGQITYSNGLETGPFPSGTIATVVCNMDYVPNGPASSTCINGVFTPPIIPQCVPEGGTVYCFLLKL